MFLEIDESLNH